MGNCRVLPRFHPYYFNSTSHAFVTMLPIITLIDSFCPNYSLLSDHCFVAGSLFGGVEVELAPGTWILTLFGSSCPDTEKEKFCF